MKREVHIKATPGNEKCDFNDNLICVPSLRINMDSVEIPLTGDRVAIVDKADEGKIANYSWWLQRCADKVYAVTRIGGSFTYMHRFIMGLGKGDQQVVDHLDGNGLNNRRCNMEVVPQRINVARMKRKNSGTSEYRGVSWRARVGKWYACIHSNYKTRALGTYDSEIEAATHYDNAAEVEFGFRPNGTKRA